jgi:hypothetical protein
MSTTAFQIGAFQFTGFQEFRAFAGGGAALRYFLDTRRRERERRRAKREREEKEAELAAVAPTIRLPDYVRFEPPPLERSIGTILLRARKPVVDPEAEMRDFNELMLMVAEIDEVLS